ncbi:copper chaperone PCu(A)C [Polynucleobacter sp. UB-Tiil-W10]|uniref:copper chaperone PCu(A)C n=1 Tax=Polynucleobacter sp. UB-Tiil-W10 TaxID=1855648 RepID=UPI001C0C52FE|nr:copper chaperone PCu(A)C [Polynucleobacter sp. UB-Tiil-W10]MBU3539822.1 copper chaperone PCu(A)C [Polynucleobacter sp. UB-Tiil-W10]
MIKSNKGLVFRLATACIGATVILSSQAFAQAVKMDAVSVSDAYTRATVQGQKVAGGFLKIQNKGNTPDQLVSASSPSAGDVQLHEMAMEGNVMKMRQVKDIAVPANGSVELKPGGYHLMFLDLKGPFVAGETIPVKLKFAKSGDVEVKLPVNAAGAMKH